MFNALEQLLMSLRARWRWGRGRCPRCNRKLYAAFASYVTAYPNCPVCNDETTIAWRVWHKHRAFATAKRAGVAGVRE
jgi:uncharacterized protein (UPF0212 family)